MVSNTEPALLEHLNHISQMGILDGEDADRKENLHRLFMYPAMMVPATQSAILRAVTEVLPKNSNAIDPFMGSGTSLLSCMEFGLNVYGQDINPFAVLLTQAKTYLYDTNVLESALHRIESRILSDDSEVVEVNYYNLDKWFEKEIQVSFSKIRRAIMSEDDADSRKFFWVIMSEAIRVGSNDRTSTFKLHRRSEEDIKRRNIDVVKEFLNLSNRGIEDFKLYRSKLEEDGFLKSDKYAGLSIIKWGNTQESVQTDIKFDLLVSSPPYGDNLTTVTYGQTSFLPLLWIDSKDIECPYDYVKTTSEIDRNSLGGKINRQLIQEQVKYLSERSEVFNRFYQSLPTDERYRYNKTVGFMCDFDKSLDAIMKVMKPNAYFIWTIGNRFVGGREIPNSGVLFDLMGFRGIQHLYTGERSILNKKQACKNKSSKTMEKELIMIFHNS